MGLSLGTPETILSSSTLAGYRMAKSRRSLQSPGLISKVYVPILLDIFNARYRQGASTIIFSLDDIRNTAECCRDAGDRAFGQPACWCQKQP